MKCAQFLATLVLLLCPALHAQTTFATLTGSVVDASGAVIPRARITARNLETNVKTTTESNAAGDYTIAQLKEGNYEVRAAAAGFNEWLARDLVLVARDERRLDIRLELGSLGTKVEVTAGATLIETETARISDSRSALTIKEIPLNSRNMYTFLALTPGLVAGSGGEVIIAGSGDNQTHWAIDGTTFDDGIQSSIGPIGNHLEWIQELHVDVANNTAEFGPLGHVTVISRSGTNQLHGSGFDYYSTPWFRARNPFALARATGVSHLYGFSVGGPVYFPKIYNGKNKTFFYTSLERNTGSQVTQLVNPTVPLPAWRDGDFSGLTGGVLIYDPQNNQPFPGNKIPSSRINPVSQQIQTMLYPLPNFGSSTVLQNQNFRANLTRVFDPSTNWTTRGDHHFSPKDSIFGRFTYERLYNRPYEDNLPTIGLQIQRRDDRAASFSYTHIFRPTVLNEFRWGFVLNNNPVQGPINGPAFVKQLGLVGLAPSLPDISGMLQVNWTGIGLQPLNQPNYNVPGSRDHLEEFTDNVSWFHGRHNAKFGATLTFVEFDNRAASANLFGAVTFSNRFSSGGIASQGNPYADFLLGIPTTAARAFPPLGQFANHWFYDFFALDDFKISSKLTLNIGVRYELHPPWHENSNRLSLFDIGLGKIVIPDAAMSQVSSLLPANYVGVVSASAAGLPQSLVSTDKNNFAPRIGLAYRPWGTRTVFRAGFGVFYDIAPREPAAAGVPYAIDEPAFTNPDTNPTVIFPRVFPATGTGGPTTVALPASINPNLRFPYTLQYNFTIEHQRWNTGFRASYIGTGTREGEWVYNINSPVPDTTAYVNKPRPYPNYPAILFRTNGAGQQYNGLILAAQRPMARGFYFQASWTWARDIYDVGRTDNAGIENPFDRKREKAVAPLTPTSRFTANWLYQIPFGKGRHWLANAPRVVNLLAGGWNVSSVFSTFSGNFLTPMWTGPDPTGTAFTTSATPPVVSIRPDEQGNPNLPGGQRSVNQWFNVAAFGPPQAGHFGTSAKDVIKGPGASVLDAGVYKEIRFREAGPLLRWEFTATNVLNHPNWSNPVSTDITQKGAVGVINGVGGVAGASVGDQPGPRALRMGLRVEW
jgi:hypothetical protein